MVKRVSVDVISKGSVKRQGFSVRRLLLAGYTGRDKVALMNHIEELSKLGVKVPERIPTCYYVSPYLLTSQNYIEVKGKETSGEVEYVAIISKDSIYITVGSDHTDRELEKSSVSKAKQICPKIIPRKAWKYEEIKDHWDDIVIRSFIIDNYKKRKYQEASLKQIMRLEDLLSEFNAQEGDVLFSGTIPTIGGISYSSVFVFEMHDPVLDRKISYKYQVKMLPDIE